MTYGPYSIMELEAQERELVLPSFSNDVAWMLGAALVTRARQEQLPVAVDVRRPGAVLFHAVLTGATADQNSWIDRKSATTLRFEAASLLVGLRLAEEGRDPFTDGWLDPARYTPAGGSFPVRARGAGVVAAVTVSGLTSEADHGLIVDTLRILIRDDAGLPPAAG